MAKRLSLTYSQIQNLVNSSTALGLDAVSVEAIRESLIMQSADLTQAQRLGVELMQAPKPTRLIVKETTKALDAVNESVMAKGKAQLLATSDEDWNRMVKGASSEQESI